MPNKATRRADIQARLAELLGESAPHVRRAGEVDEEAFRASQRRSAADYAAQRPPHYGGD